MEIVKVDKKQKPPVKSVIDRRYFEVCYTGLVFIVLQVKKFPAAVRDVTFHLDKDLCVLHIHKKAPASWVNFLSQHGF